MFKNRMKKMIAIVVSVFTLGLFMASPAKSESSEELLALIAQYTHATAAAAFYMEQYTYGLLLILNSWIMPDQSETTANLQANFGNQTHMYLNNYYTRYGLLQQLLPRFYGPGLSSDNVPYANDMTFGTLIGLPFFEKDPRKNVNPALNYIANVAGLNITHIAPSSSWTGSDYDKRKYINFYTTVSSIQSYDAFVLSQLYADNAPGEKTPSFNDAQNQLIQQASSSDWFSQVASENIGIILRQMLMYNSQIYVLLTQLVQTQKQMLATLAMTNTLIVIGDTFSENQLIQRAAVTSAQQ